MPVQFNICYAVNEESHFVPNWVTNCKTTMLDILRNLVETLLLINVAILYRVLKQANCSIYGSQLLQRPIKNHHIT